MKVTTVRAILMLPGQAKVKDVQDAAVLYKLQALVDKKRIVITKEVVHEMLQLNDAKGVIYDDVQEHAKEEVSTDVVSPIPTSPSPSSPVIPSLPPHQSPSLPQPQAAKGSSHLVQQVLDKCSTLVLRVKGLENANAAQQLEIIKLKARGRISVNMETDKGIELVVDQEKDAEIEGMHTNKQAEIYNIDLDHSSKVATASTPVPAAKPKTLKIATAAPAVSTRRRNELNFDSRSKAYEERSGRDGCRKAAKRRKLNEEAQEADDLRRRLEIIEDEDDDVFVEAIPLA
nr:hypothetical protein [Tanacetum cinerariifolium]